MHLVIGVCCLKHASTLSTRGITVSGNRPEGISTMSRQHNERSRIWAEMKDRFGEDDPMVSQWMGELDKPVSAAVCRPAERRARTRTVRPTHSARMAAVIAHSSASSH
jgi:hypothetical protein